MRVEMDHVWRTYRVGDEEVVALRDANVATGIATLATLTPAALAASLISAFFAFGGWWDLGRMGEEVESPRRTMPRALVGGLALVTAMYALVSVAYMLGTSGPVSGEPGPGSARSHRLSLVGDGSRGCCRQPGRGSPGITARVCCDGARRHLP